MASKKSTKLPPALAARIRRNSSDENDSVTLLQGLEAARQVAAEAKAEGVEYALAGGMAMHIYGFTRATKDVDIVAADLLPLPASRKLSFGGETYKVKVGKREIIVDWIVRDDEQEDVYAAALEQALAVKIGRETWPVLSPEWLVIIKYLAGRGKDHLDLLWLLREDGLVDRRAVARLVKQVFGRYGYVLLKDLEAEYLEADLMRARDEQLE